MNHFWHFGISTTATRFPLTIIFPRYVHNSRLKMHFPYKKYLLRALKNCCKFYGKQPIHFQATPLRYSRSTLSTWGSLQHLPCTNSAAPRARVFLSAAHLAKPIWIASVVFKNFSGILSNRPNTFLSAKGSKSRGRRERQPENRSTPFLRGITAYASKTNATDYRRCCQDWQKQMTAKPCFLTDGRVGNKGKSIYLRCLYTTSLFIHCALKVIDLCTLKDTGSFIWHINMFDCVSHIHVCGSIAFLKICMWICA